MTTVLFAVDFTTDFAGFEKNQQVALTRVNDSLLVCQSGQTNSTPGVIRPVVLPKLDKTYCLIVDGWANCSRVFIQVIDPSNGKRLINGYKYLKTNGSTNQQEQSIVRVNFKNEPGSTLVNVAIFFGGSNPPTLEDKFWLRSVKITDQDLSDEPEAPHRQDLIIVRPFDDVKKHIVWESPLPKPTPVNPPIFHDRKSAQNALQEDSTRLIHLSGDFYIYLDPDGYVRYVQKRSGTQ